MKLKLILFGVLLASLAPASPFDGLTDLEGNPAKWQTGKSRVLVSLWATWCPECKSKLGHELSAFDKRADVAVLAVNTEKDMGRVKHFVRSEGITIPVLVDSQRTLRAELKAFSVPHWAVYARTAQDWQLVDTAPAFELPRIEKALEKAL